MKMPHLTLLLLLAGLAAATAFTFTRSAPADPEGDMPKLDVVKALAGDWVAVGEDGRPTAEVVSKIRVTAGGSAVLETLFPGQSHEMLTVYHQSGDDLVLTHYCVAGNQPHMKARPQKDPGLLVFEHVAGSNVKSEDERHMHQGRITLVDDDRMKTEWRMIEKGEVVHTARFDLVRRRKAAGR